MKWSEQLLRTLASNTAASEREVCGFIYPERYVPLRNTSCMPDRFVADPVDIAKALSRHGEPEAIFHSHPGGQLNPSLLDTLQNYYRGSTMAIGSFQDGQFRLNLVQFAVYGHRGD